MKMETIDFTLPRNAFQARLFITILLIHVTCAASSYYDERGYRVRKRNSKPAQNNSTEEVCENSGCVDAASTVFKWVDPSTDSCDDFYRFACGDDYKEELPDVKSAVNNYGPIADLVDEKLELSNENDEKNPKVFKLLQSFYNSCMNTAQFDITSKNNFREILKKLGGWPVLDGHFWDESTFDWKKFDNKLRSMGYSMSHFISFYVALDSNDSSRRVIYIDQATLGLDREILLLGAKERKVRAYFKYMIDVAEIYGATRVQAQKELAESIFFEIQLAKISLSKKYRGDLNTTYNPMNIREIQTRYPNIPWTEYVNDLLAPSRRLENSEAIVVVVPSFLESFSDLVAKTPKRVLANYAIWRVAMQSASRMCERVQNAESEFLAALTGTSARTPRWKECFTQLGNNLHLALGALYVRKNFDDEDAKKNMVDIVDHLKLSFCGLRNDTSNNEPEKIVYKYTKKG